VVDILSDILTVPVSVDEGEKLSVIDIVFDPDTDSETDEETDETVFVEETDIDPVAVDENDLDDDLDLETVDDDENES
jgi:hypothetical protein